MCGGVWVGGVPNHHCRNAEYRTDQGRCDHSALSALLQLHGAVQHYLLEVGRRGDLWQVVEE
jgi:hypothetical protein